MKNKEMKMKMVNIDLNLKPLRYFKIKDEFKDDREGWYNFSSFRNIKEEEMVFLLEEFLPIPKRAVTFLSARGGTGKSWLVLQLALRYINKYPDKKVFAWLSEDTLSITKTRGRRILNTVFKEGKGIDDPIYDNFHILGSDTRPFHFNSYLHEFSILKKKLKEYEFIILDPLISFYGGDENNNSQAREFMNLLTEWADKENKAILLVHHNNKSSKGGIRGASAFVDAVRLHYELKRIEEDKTEDGEKVERGTRIVKVMKDNWGVESILNSDEKEIFLFKDSQDFQNFQNSENNKGVSLF